MVLGQLPYNRVGDRGFKVDRMWVQIRNMLAIVLAVTVGTTAAQIMQRPLSPFNGKSAGIGYWTAAFEPAAASDGEVGILITPGGSPQLRIYDASIPGWTNGGAGFWIVDPVDGAPEVTIGTSNDATPASGLNLYQTSTSTTIYSRTGLQNGFLATTSAGGATALSLNLFADSSLAVGAGCTSNTAIGFWTQGNRQWCFDTNGELTATGNNGIEDPQYVDLSNSTQAGLGADNEGTIRYCSDCNPDATCTGGGAGAFAFRIGSAWTCELP